MTAGDTRARTEHRTFLLVDMENSSGRTDSKLTALRTTLYTILYDALEAAGVPEEHRVDEDRGDAVLVLVDATVPKADLLGPFVERLAAGLAVHNGAGGEGGLPAWLRLRLSVHAGEVHRDPRGWSGEALTTVFRINEAAVVKATLKAADRAQCIVSVSDEIFRGVVRHGTDTEADTYRLVRLDGTAPFRTWIRVPGYPVPPVPLDPQPAPAPETRPTTHTEFHAPVHVRRDFIIGG